MVHVRRQDLLQKDGAKALSVCGTHLRTARLGPGDIHPVAFFFAFC